MPEFITGEDIFFNNNEINDEEALVQEYIDLCGYSKEDAIIAARNTFEHDSM